MKACREMVELLRLGLHVPAATREAAAKEMGMDQTAHQRRMAAGA